jgi:hypothetical protein
MGMGGRLVRRGGDEPGMGPQPYMNNGGRWQHIASDAEVRRAMKDRESEIIEAPIVGITFMVSYSTLTVLRAGAMGGDVRNVEGGWVYQNDIALRLDVQEMRTLGAINK